MMYKEVCIYIYIKPATIYMYSVIPLLGALVHCIP